MRTLYMTAGLGALLLLGACGSNRAPGPIPSSQMTAPSAGSASTMPQPTNSLPAGGTANAPRAPATGQVGTTRTY